MLGCNCFLRSLREVVPQMPAVGDLHRLRCLNMGGFGVRAGAYGVGHLCTGWVVNYSVSVPALRSVRVLASGVLCPSRSEQFRTDVVSAARSRRDRAQ